MVIVALKKLVGGGAEGGQESVLPGFLRPINVDKIAWDLKLELRGEERGRANQPGADSAIEDVVEQSIIQKIESEWAWQGGELVNQLRAYASRLLQYSIKAEFERLLLKGNDALARLRSANVQAEGDLGPLRESYVEFRNELSRFRGRHRLARPARQPARRWTTFGLMFILISLESVLNGFFFAEGSAFGLLGGVGTAIGISVVNVLFAFLLGLLPWRWVNHRNWLSKLSGVLLVLAGVALIVLVQAFAAHFREAMAAVGEERAAAVAVETLLRSPMQISEIETAYLFGLGLLFAGAAFWKGATFDDPYPRYGVVARRAAAARQDYRETHDDLFGELEDIKDETVAALDSGIAKIPSFPQHAANIRAQRSALLQTFRGYETAVEAASNQLLAKYRDANRRNRSAPAPAHFARRYRLPHSFLENADVHTLTAEVEDAILNVDAPLAELRKLSREVLDEFETLLVRYPHPTNIP